MRTPHILVDELEGKACGDTVALDPASDHHLRRVLRLKVGAALTVTDGQGRAASAALAPQGAHLSGAVGQPDSNNSGFVTLYPAVAKGQKLDVVVEKATELGVRRICPIFTSRSERRWDYDTVTKRLRRWNLIARSALEQSRGLWLPEICQPLSLLEVLKLQPIQHGRHLDGRYMLDTSGELGIEALKACTSAPRPDIQIAVGPEGGFDSNELIDARESGRRIVRLGPTVLRTETAAIVAAAFAVSAVGHFATPKN